MLKKNKTQTNLDKIIENLEEQLKVIDEKDDLDAYTKMVTNLESLYKLRDGKKPSALELKDWIPVIGSVGGILVIVTFEAFGHTLTSKSVGFVSKLRS